MSNPAIGDMKKYTFAQNFQSLSKILRRIADPVESFSFKCVPHALLPPASEDIRDGFWKGTDLIGQLHNSLTNGF